MEKSKLNEAEKISIFYRDGWKCRYCKKPLIFAPAMKYIEVEIRNSGFPGPLAYYHTNWKKKSSPLLAELGAEVTSVDPVNCLSKCTDDTEVTACVNCRSGKSSKDFNSCEKLLATNPINGIYGGTDHWDGMSSLFVVLAERYSNQLIDTDRKWLNAIKALIHENQV